MGEARIRKLTRESSPREAENRVRHKENRKVRSRKQRRRESKTQGRESESRQARTGNQPERGEGCHSHVELQGRSRHQLLLRMKCHNCPRFSVSSTIFTVLHLAWKNNSNRGVGWGAAPQLQTIRECGSSYFRSFWGQISRRCRCYDLQRSPLPIWLGIYKNSQGEGVGEQCRKN